MLITNYAVKCVLRSACSQTSSSIYWLVFWHFRSIVWLFVIHILHLWFILNKHKTECRTHVISWKVHQQRINWMGFLCSVAWQSSGMQFPLDFGLLESRLLARKLLKQLTSILWNLLDKTEGLSCRYNLYLTWITFSGVKSMASWIRFFSLPFYVSRNLKQIDMQSWGHLV